MQIIMNLQVVDHVDKKNKTEIKRILFWELEFA